MTHIEVSTRSECYDGVSSLKNKMMASGCL